MVCGSPIYFVLYGSNVNTELILSLAPYTAETRRVKATFIIFRGRYSMEITPGTFLWVPREKPRLLPLLSKRLLRPRFGIYYFP